MPRESSFDLKALTSSGLTSNEYPVTAAGPATWRTERVPGGRLHHTAVWTGTEMIVWGGEITGSGGLGGGTSFSSGGRYDPRFDSWVPTATITPARRRHSAVWSGKEMIVWGGYTTSGDAQTGQRYVPGTDTWTATNTTNAPSAREQHTAVWTGTRMIVWGGYAGVSYLSTGGSYDPVSDTWTPLPALDAPAARVDHVAVWTGKEMIVWGGQAGAGGLATGARFDPAANRWRPVSTVGAPSARSSFAAVWTGTEMIVWGGLGAASYLQTGARYDPETDEWAPLPTTGAPEARFGHVAVWTGKEMIVWGGYGMSGTGHSVASGGRYDPRTNTWTATDVSAAPLARVYPSAIWTGTKMIGWGGSDGALDTGARYAPAADTWTPTRVGAPGEPTGRYETAWACVAGDARPGGLVATGGLAGRAYPRRRPGVRRRSVPGAGVERPVAAAPDDHLRPGPDRRGIDPRQGGGRDVRRRPRVRTGIVAAARGDAVARAAHAVAAPDDHLLAGPHRDVAEPGLRGSGRRERSPLVCFGIVAGARLQIARRAEAAPHNHFRAGPHGRKGAPGRGSAHGAHRAPPVRRRIEARAGREPAGAGLSAPDDHLLPCPHRDVVHARSRRVERRQRGPRVGHGIVAPARREVRDAGVPAPHDHPRSGPDGGVLLAGRRRVRGVRRRPGVRARHVALPGLGVARRRVPSPDDHLLPGPHGGVPPPRRGDGRGGDPGVEARVVAAAAAERGPAAEATAAGDLAPPDDHLRSRPDGGVVKPPAGDALGPPRRGTRRRDRVLVRGEAARGERLQIEARLPRHPALDRRVGPAVHLRGSRVVEDAPRRRDEGVAEDGLRRARGDVVGLDEPDPRNDFVARRRGREGRQRRDDRMAPRREVGRDRRHEV